MRTPRSLLAIGVAAILGLIATPLVFDEDTALAVAIAITVVFLVAYGVVRARQRQS